MRLKNVQLIFALLTIKTVTLIRYSFNIAVFNQITFKEWLIVPPWANTVLYGSTRQQF